MLCLSKSQCIREIRLNVIAIVLIEADSTALKTTHHLRWTEYVNVDECDDNHQNVTVSLFGNCHAADLLLGSFEKC